MAAADALCWRCHAPTSALRTAQSSMRRSRHCPRNTPISISPPCSADWRAWVCNETPGAEGCGALFVPGMSRTEPRGGSGEIVHHDPDLVCIRIVGIGQIAHADSKILGGSLVCHLHMAPGSMRVEKYEQISGAITTVFTIVTLWLARRGSARVIHIAGFSLLSLTRASALVNCQSALM
jgi:hypothetical protein